MTTKENKQKTCEDEGKEYVIYNIINAKQNSEELKLKGQNGNERNLIDVKGKRKKNRNCKSKIAIEQNGVAEII